MNATPLTTEIFGDVMLVHVPEEIGGNQGDAILESLRAAERSNLVIDLDATETLDSRSLTLLLDIQDQLRDMDGEMKIVTTNAINRKILEMTRLDQHIEVFEDVVEAVKSLR